MSATRPGLLAAPSVSTLFVLRALAWSVGLFALLRLTLIEDSLIAALIEAQSAVVRWYFAAESSAVTITSSCSAADVISLCLGVVLAYPATWTRRLIGAALGLAVIVGLNIVRISTLAVLASRWPAAFGPVHVFVWPVLLTAATAFYVWQWIKRASPVDAPVTRSNPKGIHAATRFAWTAAGFLALHVALAPWTMTSPWLTTVGEWTASSARWIFNAAGIAAESHGIMFQTPRGAYLITPECLLTPVFPLYLASALSLPLLRRRRIAALAAALPFFFALGVVRVLVLAVPASAVESPLFVVHGFFQIIVGLVVVAWVCRHTPEDGRPNGVDGLRFVGAVAGGAVAAFGGTWLSASALAAVRMLGPVTPTALTSFTYTGDVQGALALAPAFQLALITAIWIGRRPLTHLGRYVLALAGLLASLVACLVVAGAWTAHVGAGPHALVIRAWSLGAPLVLAWWLFRTPSGHTHAGDTGYVDFWGDVGTEFPDLGGALSTSLYAANERALITSAVPSLTGARVLKTDLWDEAKNTRIGEWMADQGAHVFGIDISPATVRQARAEFGGRRAQFTLADVRAVPFATGSFDAIYSMGTVEHFAETQAAVTELARVLKPGGKLILGVPNKFDPFLRPVFVGALHRVDAYGYGSEKCYSRSDVKAMLEQAGLDVELESGILFIPGYLRMFELLLHTRVPALSFLTRPFVQLFLWLDRAAPRLRRHGYLLASVGIKPLD